MTIPKKKTSVLKTILLALAALLVIFLIVVAMQPGSFTVARSTRITASPRVIFPHVNELRQWKGWSPWGKLDPAMKETFEGPASGVGATYGWAGDHNVGEGRMIITESKPDELVRLRLEFIKPFAGTNTADFTFKAEGNQTLVTWTMAGEKNFISKAICMFMSMDKMVGGQFEEGLAQMKKVAETEAK